MKLIKFCNIKNIYETRTAAFLEIPFLGYHLISENDFLRKDVIKSCVNDLRNNFPKTRAILVTKEKDVEKLIATIREIEFDGVQLHFGESNNQAAALKSEFGKQFIIFQVVNSERTEFVPDQGDYVIIDKSYTGGTGKQISRLKLGRILEKHKDKKLFLAGGISPSNIYQYLGLPVEGFDIQSSIKSSKPSKEENTDYTKMVRTAELLGYTIQASYGQVGFAVQDIKQENQNLFMEGIKNGVDFFHVDISDGFVGESTDIEKTKELLSVISGTNSHLKVQLHFFVQSERSFWEIYNKLILNESKNLDIFLHINRDNYKDFSEDFIKNPRMFIGVDIKDVIDELFPWEPFIKNQMIVCLQSKEHKDRITNLNMGLKLIRYSTETTPIISIDRSINYETLLGIEDYKFLNVVCGSYFKKEIDKRYIILKEYLNGKNK